MMHDPETYHESMAFKPERFLETEGHVPEMDPILSPLGFGAASTLVVSWRITQSI